MRLRTGLLAIILVGCNVIDGLGSDESASTAQGSTDLKLGEKRWVALSSPTPVAPEVTLVGDELVLRLGGYFVENATLAGEKFVRVSLPEHTPLVDAGLPELPKVRVNVPLATTRSAGLKITNQKFANVPSNPPLPSRGEITRDVNPDTVPYAPGPFYASDDTFPAKNVELGDAFELRDLHGAPVQFQPFQYDAKAKMLRVSAEIRVRVNGTQSAWQTRPRGDHFEDVYAAAFAAVEQPLRASERAYPDVTEPGRLLVVTTDTFADAVAPLVDWKIRRGLETTVKRIAAGTTADAIKSLIKGEFESPKSLTYVILVGDADTLPTLKGGKERADCDACYAMVRGNDYYPDLYVSRITGRSVDQIESQVAKFVAYERTPDANGTWYNKAVGIASNEGSPTDKVRTEELRVALEGYGYASVAKIYDPGATAAQVATAVNGGVGLINYMGHGSGTEWVTTGFDVTDVTRLDNAGKWPFVIDVACQNGSFVKLEPAFAEAWLRQGTKASPKGAIGMYSASTNTAWVPPTVMQAWAVRELLVKEKRNTAGSLAFGGAARVLETNSASEGQMLVEQYNLFGDASLVLRTKQPRALVVSQNVAQDGTNVGVRWADGSVAKGTTVAISTSGAVVAVGVTDEGGNVHLTHARADGAALTVTGYNAIPFEGSLAR